MGVFAVACCFVTHSVCLGCRHLISIFNDHELELLISGLPDIDISDLRANTEYHGYSPNAPVVRWGCLNLLQLDLGLHVCRGSAGR